MSYVNVEIYGYIEGLLGPPLLNEIAHILHADFSLNPPKAEITDMKPNEADNKTDTETGTSVALIDARIERRVRMKIDCVVLPLVHRDVLFAIPREPCADSEMHKDVSGLLLSM